jgi:ABC-2 type transport system ATP-binding protein
VSFGVHGASVTLGGVLALSDVTLPVPPGTVAAVVGGDGAGKTTLLRCLVGEVPLEAGHVVAPEVRALGYLPATAGSWGALTVRQNMDFTGGVFGLAGAALDQRRDAVLARAGLADVHDRPAAQLSGGMRRKLGFCMAVLHQPALLVLDEPTTGVDPVSRVDLWRLVSEAAAAGTAVVMSTTYLDEAERASRLLALDGGRVLAQGTLDEVLASLPGTVVRTQRPQRPSWSWRRGQAHHEYWPPGAGVPAGDVRVTPDLQDTVVALALQRRGRHEPGRAA